MSDRKKKPTNDEGATKKHPNIPLYQKMVRELQKEILQGQYPVGTPLPSEAKLAERFLVSRHTVREALRALREAGLVSSRQGLGTIVIRQGAGQSYVHQVNTISDLFPKDVVTRYEKVEGRLIALPDWSKFTSELEAETQWIRIAGTRSHPNSVSPFNELVVFVEKRFAGVGRVVGLQPGPIYGLIEALYGETIGEVRQIVSAFECDGSQGRELGMQHGDIGIEIRRIYRLASDGEIAMLSFNRYLPEAFSFSMTLRKVRE